MKKTRTMNEKKSDITELQWISLLTGAMIGMGITTLPRELAEATGRDGWVSMLAATIIVIIYASICLFYARMFPTKTLAESLQLVLGKWLGGLVVVVFALYTFVVSAIVIRAFLEIIHVYFDVTAPAWLKTFLPLIVIIYMARCGLASVARMAEIVFMLGFPFLVIVFSPIIRCNPNHMLPIFEEGIAKPFLAVQEAAFAFFGVETIILVFYPYLGKKKTAFKVTYIGVAIVGLIYTVISLTTLLVLGLEQVQLFYWPFVEVLKTIRVVIIERIDNLFLYFWAVKITMVASIMYFAGTFSLSNLTKKKYNDRWAMVSWPVLYIAAIYPDSLVDLEEFSALVSNYAGIFILSLPVILIIVAKLRGVTDDESNKEKRKNKKAS